MSDPTRDFFNRWAESVDVKAMMTAHYCRVLGVSDLSEVPMVSESQLWANRSGGPMCAIDSQGRLLYEAPLFIYHLPPRA